jgi:hypothetical protein
MSQQEQSRADEKMPADVRTGIVILFLGWLVGALSYLYLGIYRGKGGKLPDIDLSTLLNFDLQNTAFYTLTFSLLLALGGLIVLVIGVINDAGRQKGVVA